MQHALQKGQGRAIAAEGGVAQLHCAVLSVQGIGWGDATMHVMDERDLDLGQSTVHSEHRAAAPVPAQRSPLAPGKGVQAASMNG